MGARVICLSVVLALAGCGDTSPGARRAYDEALAALREGALDEADAAARVSIEAGDDAVTAHARFVRGNVAYARSEVAEAEWRRPGGDPRAFQAALMYAEDALRYWQSAAASRSDWPVARRNVERALLRLEALRERKQSGGKARPKPAPGNKPSGTEQKTDTRPPTPPNPGDAADRDPEAKPETALRKGDLPAAEVLSLFERLQAKEREKRALRRAQRRARAAHVERDW